MLRDDIDGVGDQAYTAKAIDVITNRGAVGGGPAAAAPKSWIEQRYVKRRGKVYGPYRYRRWRENGRMRSRYIGKVGND